MKGRDFFDDFAEFNQPKRSDPVQPVNAPETVNVSAAEEIPAEEPQQVEQPQPEQQITESEVNNNGE